MPTPPLAERTLAARERAAPCADPPTARAARGAGEPTAGTVTGWSPPVDGHGLFKSLLLRLPRGVRRSFDHEQLLALRQAAEEIAWGEHPIDIRLRLPWPGGGCYLLLIAGRDRRGRHRRSPPVRVGNHASMAVLVALAAGLATVCGLAAARLFGA